MKYEAPELTPLTPAIDAIQGGKAGGGGEDFEALAAYEDWE